MAIISVYLFVVSFFSCSHWCCIIELGDVRFRYLESSVRKSETFCATDDERNRRSISLLATRATRPCRLAGVEDKVLQTSCLFSKLDPYPGFDFAHVAFAGEYGWQGREAGGIRVPVHLANYAELGGPYSYIIAAAPVAVDDGDGGAAKADEAGRPLCVMRTLLGLGRCCCYRLLSCIKGVVNTPSTNKSDRSLYVMRILLGSRKNTRVLNCNYNRNSVQ